MKTNILLHGATNCRSSNYGDFIYGDMIYDYFYNKNCNVKFYQPSTFFKKYLKNYDSNCFKKKNTDVIVYVPGGYFGEGHNATYRDNIVQFFRFMPLGIWGSLHRKKMLVLGIGANPLNNFLMRYGVKKICNSSSLITTRDDESYECLKKISKPKKLINCGDLILTYDVRNHLKETKQIDLLKKKSKGKKIILIHYNHSEDALIKFAKAINKFEQEDSNYYYVVVSDSILENENLLFDKFNSIFKDAFHFVYNDPYELSALLDISNIILTTKLHVGVIGCLMNKSVISVACHYEKTSRFYYQINESERCISLDKANIIDIYNLLIKYKNKNVYISSNIINNANKTWIELNKEVLQLNEKRKKDINQ